ncbi:ABC transporter permease [Halobacillus halophilus]|uniref:ABC transporter permease n=1 Tax=Halobacillus halophilus TaxID=1570 RepID=UPI001CD5B41E|nr:ABC transporter permease subunit [Halobacillus halophilus]MCA1010134.1 ABC transporter permease [Halobacillus halophilus]
MQWLTVFNKELLESWRNFKWIWVPLVFILLAITDPLTTYYLPQILEATGGLPEGATFEMPEPPPTEVFMMSVSQLNLIGVLIIALISMGTISGERKSGVAELILVKPIAYHSYVTAKWAAYTLLIWVSTFIALLASWYYVNLLFGEVSAGSFLRTVFFYGLWMTFILTISIFMNTFSKTAGLVLFFTIALVIALNLLSSVFAHVVEWSPALISSHLRNALISGELPSALWGSAGTAVLFSIILLAAAAYTLKHKEIS